MIEITSELLAKWNRAVPRYTSYPTAPQFVAVDESLAREKMIEFDQSGKSLSIYIHIPFCKSMCLFCGCSVVLNRNPARQAAYLDTLLKEIELIPFREKKVVTQLHLGGGTPTSLTEVEMETLMNALRQKFIFTDEIAIEVDPRTVYADDGKKLAALKEVGFNRISFGVQDLDPQVQEAVKRRQSEEMTVTTYERARALGFEGINIDLIYGLPLQTAVSFRKTAETLCKLKPDRISFFSYAKIPWLKNHQKAIREEDLPSDTEKFQIYIDARKLFLEAGYVAIGMDHFALQTDSLAIAQKEGRLYRNFQGYSVEKAEDLLGLGVTSIGFISGTYLQNAKTLEEYEQRISMGKLPTFRGFELKTEDYVRRWVIHNIMCNFRVDKQEFKRLFAASFDDYFSRERQQLEMELVEEDEAELRATPKGKLFVRLIAASFDGYLAQGQFSKAL
jgi:oxygen-independent coproporphyrinogen-3 oxidase